MGFYVPNVRDIEIAKDNPYFDSRENCNCIIETKTNKILIAGLNNPKIPSTVKEIGSFAFYMYNQTELTIPSNVKKIDSCAFMECESLKSIKLEEGVEEVAIYAFVLWDIFIKKDSYLAYDNLNEIYIPSTTKKISEVPFALYHCLNTKLYYNGSDFSSIVSKDLCPTDVHSIGFTGKTVYRNGKFKCSNVCGVLKAKPEYNGFANTFIAEYLDSITYKYVSYVGNPKLMNKVMAKIKIKYPPLEEQEKISKLFESVDLSVEILQNQKENVEKFKKGLLQQMFV